ncbi:MAG: acyl-ACP--UDP-N-acetylglucosamine O-acyltransferase [Phycisphaerales bacterium]|nr:MAG: acyl-ACP--UDP-N-acetylglucosamine O-acyltransferase [Phycisphaerales bacterium]
MAIHSTAIVDRQSEVDPAAEIGPYAVIEGPVRIGPQTRIYPHAFITGWTQIGARCQIHPGAVVGHLPQDLAYQGAESYCRIGDETIIREGASIHRGTVPGSETVVGRRCFIMANAHVAHNCCLGDEVKLANNVMLGGHVRVGGGAFIAGGTGVHQFVRIGELVMIGGNAAITMDVPPYFAAVRLGYCVGPNVVGLRRAGFSPEQRNDVKQAYKVLYRSKMPFSKATETLTATVTTDAGRRILEFLREPSQRGIIGGPRRWRAGVSEAAY